MTGDRTAPDGPRERGIIFSAPMVQAILAGEKTQTRRLIRIDDTPISKAAADSGKLQRGIPSHARNVRSMLSGYLKCDAPPGSHTVSSRVECPYGTADDRLWVRETWQAWRQTSVEYDEHEALTRDVRGGVSWADWVAENGEPHVEYRATSKSMGPWIPAIHMPRWASRITLQIASIRVQQLHDISDEDITAEGVTIERVAAWTGAPPGDIPDLRSAWRLGWERIHGEGAWAENPWLWAISFRWQERTRP